MGSTIGGERVLAARAIAVIAAVLLLGAVACSNGGGDEAAGGGGDAGGQSLATLKVLDDAVAVAHGEGAAFEPAQSGASLGIGDEVQTDAAGLAEISYFDGSWQRIENQSVLTLTELVDIEGGKVVRTGLDQGRAWQRVQALTTDEDSFEVDTPVAVGSVRGTEFSIDCTVQPVACTFAVVEGVVELALSGGTTVTLQAGDLLSVSRDQPVGTPLSVGVDQLRQDPWIAKNLQLDATQPPTRPGTTGGTGAPTATAPTEFASQANAICVSYGEQSDAALGAGSSDDVARQQAVVLNRALDQLASLQPPSEIAADYSLMIDSYRRRTALVDQALAASADERPALVTQLLSETATGADAARRMGLTDCILRSS
jgi:hypothetical protein